MNKRKEGEKMKTKLIKIIGINDLSDFITKANEVEGDILVQKGKFVVDGKSLLGIMSIDISSGAKIEYPEDAIEFDKYLERFEA